jgi:hypothetical protein
MSRIQISFTGAAVILTAALFWWATTNNTGEEAKNAAPVAKRPHGATVVPVANVERQKTFEPGESAPTIELVGTGVDVQAQTFMSDIMKLTTTEVQTMLEKLSRLPLTSPEAQAVSVKLQWRITKDDLQYVIDLIDSSSVSNEGKETLIHLVSELANPSASEGLRSLMTNPEFAENEPLFHAAVKSLVRFGSPEDIAPVFQRLQDSSTPGAFDALVTLLVEHNNPAGESYLLSLIQDSNTSEDVRRTSVYMLANHTSDASMALLQNIANSNGNLSAAAAEALVKQQSKR